MGTPTAIERVTEAKAKGMWRGPLGVWLGLEALAKALDEVRVRSAAGMSEDEVKDWVCGVVNEVLEKVAQGRTGVTAEELEGAKKMAALIVDGVADAALPGRE